MRFNKSLFQSKSLVDNDILSYHFKEQCKVQRRINATMPSLKCLHDQPSVRVKANGAIVVNKQHHTSIPLDWVPTIVSEQHDQDVILDNELCDKKDNMHGDNYDNYDDDDDSEYVDNRHRRRKISSSGNSLFSVPNSNSSSYSADTFLSAPPLRNRTSLSVIGIYSTLAKRTAKLRQVHQLHQTQRQLKSPGITRSTSLPFMQPSSPADPYHLSYERKIDILLEEMKDIQQESTYYQNRCDKMQKDQRRLHNEIRDRDEIIHSLQLRIRSLAESPPSLRSLTNLTSQGR